jgi:hypothetical protein
MTYRQLLRQQDKPVNKCPRIRPVNVYGAYNKLCRLYPVLLFRLHWVISQDGCKLLQIKLLIIFNCQV